MSDADRSTIVALINQRAARPGPPYWFYHEAGTDYDEAYSFCKVCIRSILPDAQIGVHYGGGYCGESDSPEVCERCGALLQYTLTNEGVDAELEHFLEYPADNPGTRRVLNLRDWWCCFTDTEAGLVAVLASTPTTHDERWYD
jgi:hypothetical protein